VKLRKFSINEAEVADPESSDKPKEKSKTPWLDILATDITKAAKDGKLEPVVGRKKEIKQTEWILARKNKNNPVLIGEPGTGKTAIVEGLAKLIVEGKCSAKLKGKRIFSLEMGSLIAGASEKGKFEGRVKSIIKEVEEAGNVILFIDEIHLITKVSGDIDAANMLKPALARGVVQIIGATTLNEFRTSIEKDGALERRFQKVMVEETTPEETLEILNNIKTRYEDYHKVTYTPDALKACVDLAGKHIPERFFPDKAIDLMDEVGAKAHLDDEGVDGETPKEISELEDRLEKLQSEIKKLVISQKFEEAGALRKEEIKLKSDLSKAEASWKETKVELPKIEITSKDVAEVFSIKTGIPTEKFSEEEGTKLLKIADNLKMDVIGQDEAVTTISKCIKRNRAGLKDPKRPIGVFLFLGKTGVGKTQLAKSLAKHLFGSEDSMIRVDMSEYHEKHNVSRMIGSPPGYVGYGEGGQLTEKVRRKPYSVVLLDEIEKAHPDVLSVFLQVFDDGQLTDGSGRKVSFKNTIIIMTSNIGTDKIKDIRPNLGFVKQSEEQKEDEIKDIMRKELNNKLAPEFINRIDDIIIFSSLNKEHLHSIIDIELKKLGKRLEKLGYTLNVTPAVKDFLIEKGFDEKMGARPLNRAIQRYVEDPLSDEILRKEIKDVVNIDYDPKSGILINNNPIRESLIKKFSKFKILK
jgi:ATP-dependent Clp protease ATP-binding subunit ClpC